MTYKTRMSRQDRESFALYCQNCTDAQIVAVYKKERDAGRRSYATIAKDEAERRGLKVN